MSLWRKRLPLRPEQDCEPDLPAAVPVSAPVGIPGPPARAYERGPAIAKPLAALLRFLEQAGDYLWGTRYNPVLRSGTLAVLMLLLATFTGVILIFYYRLGDPWSSVLRLQEQAWFGRWLRSWHRYLSDAAIVATILHVLRMAGEGKAWGPRVLAWISGIVLVGAVLFTGWTGFVMAWDTQGLRLAQAGARVADLLPLFPEPISRAFSGGTAPPPSFFFMNLFLHVALPLGLVMVLWVHTARLARAAWLPERKELWVWGGLALAAALIWPAPLGLRADPLALGGSYPLDLFYNAWLPAALGHHPLWTLAGGAMLVLVPASMPWWWRPKAFKRPLPSRNDEARCQGCVTCVNDCPFEAIAMVPREQGQGSALVARVDPGLCVSCGLCVASCDRMSIGPMDRMGPMQMAQVQALTRDEAATSKIVLIYCRQSPLSAALLAQVAKAGHPAVPWAFDCIGDLHPFTVQALQQRFAGVFVLSCAPAACQMREGATLARKRLLEGYEPANKVALNAAALSLVQVGSDGGAEAWARWQSLRHALDLGPAPQPIQARPWARALRSLLVLPPLVYALALAAAFTAGRELEETELRLTWRLPGQAIKDCRDRTPQELAAMPAHMRQKQDCKTRRLSYRFQVNLDGELVQDQTIAPQGVRHDSPLNVDLRLPLAQGQHQLSVSFAPLDEPQGPAKRLSYQGSFSAQAGRTVLLTWDKEGKELELLSQAR